MATDCIGVDLGLTQVRAAWLEEGRPVLLETLTGQRSVPAFVGLDRRGALHVGETARNQNLMWPERAAGRLRRLLGTSQRVYLDDKSFTGHELCAVLLSQVRELADERLGGAVTHLTLAVPCAMTQLEQQAARDAVALAGFRGVKLVLEPLAIARAHGLLPEQFAPAQPVLVCDVGARGCEAAILLREDRVLPGGGKALPTWAVRSSAGSQVGGEAFDLRILAHFCTLFERDHGISPRGSRRALARLRLAAEWAKCQLSQQDSVMVRVAGLLSDGQQQQDLVCELSREQLTLLIEDDVRKCLEAVELALRDARLSPTQLQAVVLSGGGALLPLVGDVLSELVGSRPKSGCAVDESIAFGAALLGAG
jgi:molecular chaperone DnaK